MKNEKKGKSMRDLFHVNADLVAKSFHAMGEAVIAFCQNKNDLIQEKVKETISIEKTQDRSRDELVKKIFSKETMVFSRPDRLNIIESIDKLCDEAEIVVRKLVQYNPTASTDINTGLKDMAGNVDKIGREIQGC